MALGQRVKEAREYRGLKQGELADRIGWTQQALSTLENRDSQKSSYSAQIASALNISVSWLIDGLGDMLDTKKQDDRVSQSAMYVPVRGSAQMGDDGFWLELDYMGDGGDGYLEVTGASEKAYAIRPVGDSMYPALRSGWYMVFEPNLEPCAGEYVHVVLKDGRNMIKEYVSCQHGILTLISVNGNRRLSFRCDEVEVLNPFIGIQPPSRLRLDIDLFEAQSKGA